MLSQSSKYKGCLRGEVCRPVKTFFVISFFHTKPHIGSGDFMDINKNNNNIVPCVMLFHNFSFRLNRYTRYKKGISLLRNVLNEQNIFDRLQQKSYDKLQALHFPVPAGWRHGVAKSNLVSILNEREKSILFMFDGHKQSDGLLSSCQSLARVR